MLDFGKLIHQCLFRFFGEFDTFRKRTAGGEGHLHGEVAFVQCRDELGAQAGEEKEGTDQCGKSNDYGACFVMQARMQATLVEFVQLLEESVGKCRLHYDGMFQEERRHHRDVCQ